MSQQTSDPHRALVDLFPQYLMRRMRGWAGLQSILDETGLAGQGRVLLRARYGDRPWGEHE